MIYYCTNELLLLNSLAAANIPKHTHVHSHTHPMHTRRKTSQHQQPTARTCLSACVCTFYHACLCLATTLRRRTLRLLSRFYIIITPSSSMLYKHIGRHHDFYIHFHSFRSLIVQSITIISLIRKNQRDGTLLRSILRCPPLPNRGNGEHKNKQRCLATSPGAEHSWTGWAPQREVLFLVFLLGVLSSPEGALR